VVEQNSTEKGQHRSKKCVALLGHDPIPGMRWPPHFVAVYVYSLSQCDWLVKGLLECRAAGIRKVGERVGPQATCYETP